MRVTQHQLQTLHNEIPAINTSDKYSLVKTIDVINTFKDRGFTVSAYEESRVRNAEKQNKMKHFVRMKIDTDSGVDREIVIMNSHDGSSSLKLNFGAFRMVCNNQLVFGDSLLPTERIVHSLRNPWERINTYTESVMSKLAEEKELRDSMMRRHLTALQMEEFTERAVALREDDMSKILDFRAANLIRRPEDSGKTIWNTYNRLQENLIQGGSYRKLSTFTNQDGLADERYVSAKRLTDHARIITVNKQLHELALEYV